MDPARAHAVQHKIRADALERQQFMASMSQWEKGIRKRDKEMRGSTAAAASLPPVRGGVRVDVRNTETTVEASPSQSPTPSPSPASGSSESAAKHTYDKGYGKWENFNVDAALAEVEEERPKTSAPEVPSSSSSRSSSKAATKSTERRLPASKPRDAEVAQREIGNACFAKGDYQGAIKSYTLCLGLKKGNAVALSNRAMAYLKLKQYHNADADCTAALNIDPKHLKSLQRRATARDALGRHRAAIMDVQDALALQPDNKALAQQRLTIRKHIQACVEAAPFVPIDLNAAPRLRV